LVLELPVCILKLFHLRVIQLQAAPDNFTGAFAQTLLEQISWYVFAASAHLSLRSHERRETGKRDCYGNFKEGCLHR
jgi:hypothetical protein